MVIKFITGNENKLKEARSLLGKENVELLKLDLPEIQDIDPKKVIEAKLLEALKTHRGEFIVEDTSFGIDALNGFPGPLIKWLLESVGVDGLADLVLRYKNQTATTKCLIGYAKQGENDDDIHMEFFEGVVKGTVVSPRGDNGFQFDRIFIPEGHKETFAEMPLEEKNKISHRKKAFQKLKEKLFP